MSTVNLLGRGVTNTLPYAWCPDKITIHLMYFMVMLLEIIPEINGEYIFTSLY